RRVLPLGLALRARNPRAARSRLRRTQLRGLVARVVAPRRAAARALRHGLDKRPPVLFYIGVRSILRPAACGSFCEEGPVAVRLRAWSSLGGVAFTVLVAFGAMLLFDGPSDSSPAKVTAWYSSSRHRPHLNIGWLLAWLGLLCLIWFVAGVRERIAAAEIAERPGVSFLSTVVTIGGTAFVAAGICLIGIAAGIKTMSDDTYHHQVYSGLVHAAGDAAYIVLAGSGVAMASMILAISLAIFAYGLLPRWVGWFGVVAAVAAIFSIMFFTMLLWLLWIAVASVMFFVRSRSPVTSGEPVAAV